METIKNNQSPKLQAFTEHAKIIFENDLELVFDYWIESDPGVINNMG